MSLQFRFCKSFLEFEQHEILEKSGAGAAEHVTGKVAANGSNASVFVCFPG